MYNILVIGAVETTAVTIKSLLKHQFNVVGVLGHEPINKERVSGLADLKTLAEQNNIDYKGYKKINATEFIKWAEAKTPDIIFAIGFSQLLHNVWLQMPKLGCVGFHPTKLPEGRGRAPLAWITLEKKVGSATFFLMGDGADDGPIFIQSLFKVEENDDATTVGNKILLHIEKALDIWLPQLKKGIWNPTPQDHSLATWLGKRAPEDGCINWYDDAFYIDRLIKASSKPHPGAFTFLKNNKCIVWKSKVETIINIKGVVGRILLADDDKFLIQCGIGLLWIYELEIENNPSIKVGDKLGYDIQNELYKLNKLLNQ